MENILITKEKLLIKECLKKETYLSASFCFENSTLSNLIQKAFIQRELTFLEK